MDSGEGTGDFELPRPLTAGGGWLGEKDLTEWEFYRGDFSTADKALKPANQSDNRHQELLSSWAGQLEAA